MSEVAERMFDKMGNNKVPSEDWEKKTLENETENKE